MYSLPIVATLVAALVSACPIVERDLEELEARQTGCQSYNYNQMGANWASECPQWAQCSNGDQQSPINLPANSFASTHVPTISFPGGSRVAGQIFNRGFGPEWIPNSGVQVPRVSFDGGPALTLLQWHTHTPTSEHAVGGARTRAEIHFVFSQGGTPSAVLGVRMANGNGSPLWSDIFNQLNRQGRQLPPVGNDARIPISIDFSALLNSNFFGSRRYWTYSGSLTTPNCAQGIRWYVSGRNDALSANQFQRLEGASINSVRELQIVINQQVNS